MFEQRLTIPLNQPNPARQRMWRAVWLGLLIALGILIGVIAYRIINFRGHSLAWPDNAVTAIRLPKTPENVSHISTILPGTLASADLPLNISQELALSKHEITLFFDSTGQITGLATDRKLATKPQVGRTTTLTNAPTIIRRNVSFWLIWPNVDGLVLILNDHKISSSPLVITKNLLSILGNFSVFSGNSNLSLGNDSQPIAFFSAPPKVAESLIPAVPAVFPGLQQLTTNLKETGFSAIISPSNQGLAYAISLNQATLDPEELGIVVKELAQIKDLSRQDWTSGLNIYNELRGAEVQVGLSHDVGINRVTATAPDGSFIRAVQSDQTTIISNRPANIEQRGHDKTVNNVCMAHYSGFLAPKQIRQLLTPAQAYQVQDFGLRLQQTTYISWSKTHLNICW